MIRLAVALLFWIAVALIQKLNWELGGFKALVLLAVLASLPVILAVARRAEGDSTAGRAVVIAALALLALQTGYAAKELRHPSLIDAATTTLDAGDLLRRGANPYAARLDSSAEKATGEARFSGYKYLPLTIAAYLPLGTPWRERGIVATNLLLHLATVWLIFRLAHRMAGSGAGWIAVLLYLSLPLVPFQLFAKGILDLVAVLPLLAALLLVERAAVLAGFCVGLSLSAKLLPGALFLPCCLPAGRRARLAYGLGVALGLLPVIPFLAWAPTALADNIVVFNAIRPADTTSWLIAAFPLAATIAHCLFAAFYVAAAAYIWRCPPAFAVRAGLGAMLVLAAILAGPTAHHNYQLWWLPLAAALLGAALAPQRLPRPAVSRL
ncbi:MAG: hypothetical protein ACLQJR_32265 [Stellaceae bacterium]